jgi:hypothetical protein
MAVASRVRGVRVVADPPSELNRLISQCKTLSQPHVAGVAHDDTTDNFN